MNFPVVGGGFALLATTGNVLAGLGGPAAAAAGAVILDGVPGVVTGFMPLAVAGAAGILGGTFKYRMILSDVCFYQEYRP